MDKDRVLRHKVKVNGMVQGVGFRPFVFRIAGECGLGGFVNNSSAGVLIEVEGALTALDSFHERMQREAPPLARVVSYSYEQTEVKGEDSFTIQASTRESQAGTLITPDAAICEDCLRELFDPRDRRYGYPFINCTNCGPRFTIVREIPYDRPKTSMAVFTLCPECEREYHDPLDRRFHAQPNACPACGPEVRLCKPNRALPDVADPIATLAEYLRAGQVAAVRGLGGYHLVVDATNDKAVRTLRARKGREEKPFALMAPDLDTIKKFCRVSMAEARHLLLPTRPIVLLEARRNHPLAPAIAPDTHRLGFMLPYTPLHYLLLQDRFDALVMTSGNFTDEPIAIGNGEAFKRLASLADVFLTHNREILQRCDDSIVQLSGNDLQILRRARGFVPGPVFLKTGTVRPILACGGQLKNVFAISRGNEVFPGQHIGDMDHPATLEFFEHGIRHLKSILEIEPEVIAHDLHPDYITTKWAKRQTGLPLIAVQHHHAHLASVLAEHGIEEPCIGIILDGTGYGSDGTIWGGEVLLGNAGGFHRHAWLQPMPMPGGTAAIRQPRRLALAALFQCFGPEAVNLDLPFHRSLRPAEANLIIQMIQKNINTPMTSSCGRLFDTVAALLNVRTEVNYEAQAAIALESAIDPEITDPFPNIADVQAGPLPTSPLIRALVDHIRKGANTGALSARFHHSLVEIFLSAARGARKSHDLHRVALSGGVFQNIHFLAYLRKRLVQDGFEVILHSELPCNDGGIALGQIAVANTILVSRGRS